MRVALIGWPLDHSVSPAMHNAAFRVLGLPWSYTLRPTPAKDVATALAELTAQGFRGINITVPHKQAVLCHLDEVSEAARTIGAVNTILVQNGRLLGHNTDSDGFLRSLLEAGCEPHGRRALILGAGGAARAVVYALGRNGCRVTVYSRTSERGRQLALDMRDAGISVSVISSLTEVCLSNLDLLINATPVGMWPNVNASPWPDTMPIPSSWTVVDLVYNPEETRLLARAAIAGASTIGGLGMLVHQGAMAFELWTGESPPINTMLAAARAALKQKH